MGVRGGCWIPSLTFVCLPQFLSSLEEEEKEGDDSVEGTRGRDQVGTTNQISDQASPPPPGRANEPAARPTGTDVSSPRTSDSSHMVHSADLKPGAHFGHWLHWDDVAWGGGGAVLVLVLVVYFRQPLQSAVLR